MTVAAGPQEFLLRAAALLPALRERANTAEELRHIPGVTVEDLTTSGLLRIANPARYGGPGLDYDAVLEVAVELGRACGSTAWCYTVWSSHNWLIGFYPAQAQEEYFASTPDVLCSSAFNAALGRAQAVAGGYQLSGHWDFSSGCDAASWALPAAVTPDRALACSWSLCPGAQAARLAEACAEVECARLIMRRDLAEAFELAARDEQPSLEGRLRYRRDHCYVATLCMRAVNRLFEASGGHAILESSPLQRAHRDVHAGSHHVILGWDGPAEQHGRVRSGLEPTDGVI
jgi:alkylation response protein AidB-like acyl-CoA dehydrogenase